MRMTLAAACMMAFAALAPAQTQPDLPTIPHDARALTRDAEVNWPPPELPLRAAFASVAASRSLGPPKVRALDENLLIELLRDAARDDQSGIVFDDGMVIVKGPGAVRMLVEARIQSLTAALLQEVRLEAYSLTPGPATPSGVLAAADVDRVLAEKGAVVLEHDGRPRPARLPPDGKGHELRERLRRRGGGRRRDSQDPVVRVLQEGLEPRAWVGQAAGRRLILRFASTRAGLAETLAARSIGSTRVGPGPAPEGALDRPRRVGRCRGRGGLLARHDGGLRRRDPRPRAPRERPRAQTTAAASRVLFADDLLGSPIVATIPRVHDDQRSESEKTTTLALVDPRTGPLRPARPRRRRNRERRARTIWLSRSSARSFKRRCMVAESRIHFRRNPATASRVREILGTLAKGSRRTSPSSSGIGTAELPAGPWNPDDLASKLKIAAAVPATGSDQFLILAARPPGRPSSTTDVEIAQKVVIADPKVAAALRPAT